jgi:hypothetical protein
LHDLSAAARPATVMLAQIRYLHPNPSINLYRWIQIATTKSGSVLDQRNQSRFFHSNASSAPLKSP